MTQKIFNTLQKIPPSVRCVWGAVLVALLVHLLLLLLFSHTPAQSAYDAGELPKVGRIVLSDKSNAGFAQWMKNHDPAVMTMPDTVRGYSSVLNSTAVRPEPEDLPNLMQPVIPQPKSSIRQIAPLKVANTNLLLPYSIARSNGDAAENRAVLPAVALNGEYSPQIDKILALELSEIPSAKLNNLQNLPDTVLEIVPGRLAAATPRVLLAKSCGNSELDRKAMETLYKYMLKSSPEAGYCGRALFIWQNVRLPETVDKESKI